MRRYFVVLVMLCTMVLVVTRCQFALSAGAGDQGIPVAQVATLLRGAAADVETWDLNADGVIDQVESIGVGSAIAARRAAAIATAGR